MPVKRSNEEDRMLLGHNTVPFATPSVTSVSVPRLLRHCYCYADSRIQQPYGLRFGCPCHEEVQYEA
jgi:hypothetical protein